MAEIICPLNESARISKHEPAIIAGNQQLLYAELDECVSTTAQTLREKGCAPGDRIGLLMRNDWSYPIILLSLIRLGAVACPLSTRMPPAALRSMMKSISCSKVIVALRETEITSREDLDIIDVDELISLQLGKGSDKGLIKIPLNQPSTIIFTSGSSGEPKAVLHSYGNHYYNAVGANANIHLRSHDRWLVSLPLYHVGGVGIIFRCVLAGATMVLQDPDLPLESTLVDGKITHLSLVATQLQRLMQSPEGLAALKKTKAVVLGGGPVPCGLVKRARAEGIPVYTSYGLTEMASQVTTTCPDAPPDEQITSGKLLRHRELMIDNGANILVRGSTLFQGYVHGEVLERPLDEEGWFHTGDVGEFDEQGFLRVLGRRDNMFVSGGENIFPEEIEVSLSQVSEINRAVVVPIPDQEFGHRPVAFVKTAEGKALNAEQIEATLSERLPRFKIPVSFLEWPDDVAELLETADVDRSILAQLALASHKQWNSQTLG